MSQDELYTIKEQAQTLIDLDRYAEAQSVITKGLAIAPDDYYLLCLMSLSFIRQEKWKDALQYAKKAVESNPEDSWSHRLLAITYKNGGRRHEAVKAAKEAVRLDAYEPSNWHTLASTQLQIYDLKASRATTEKLREIAPDWSMTHQMFSLIALEEENYKEAETHCRRELEIDPTSYTGLNNLGVALMNQGRKREAIEIFNSAAKLDPNEYHAKDNLESAVSQYIPQIGIGIGAIWIVVQGLRILENINRTLAIAAFVLIVSAAVIFFAYRKWRYRTLPKETKDYMNYLKKQTLPYSTSSVGTDWKRTALKAVCGISGFFLVLWFLVLLIDSTTAFVNLTDLILPFVLAVVFGFSLFVLIKKR